MARHEKEFRVDAEAPLNLNELLALLGQGAETGDRSREDAIACYLSRSEGWREAMRKFSGALADESGLKDRKQD